MIFRFMGNRNRVEDVTFDYFCWVIGLLRGRLWSLAAVLDALRGVSCCISG